MRRDHELSGSVAGICFFLAIVMVIIAILTGCVEHRVTAPQLDAALDKMATLKPPVKCRKLDLLPLPAEIHVDISEDNIHADAGGEQLLRGYVSCYSAAKAAP